MSSPARQRRLFYVLSLWFKKEGAHMKRLGLTLKQRVLLGLTVLVALLLTLAAFSWRDVHQNRETIERMVHLDARKVSLANSVSSRLARVSRELYVSSPG